MLQGELGWSAFENINCNTWQQRPQHTEKNGKDNIAQSHHATVVRTRKKVKPLHTLQNNIVYDQQHCPSSAKQTWLTY